MVNIVDLHANCIEDLAQLGPNKRNLDTEKTELLAEPNIDEHMEHAPKPPRQYRPTDLLSRKEAALYLGVAEQTLAVWKSTGRHKIPILKIGRLVRYRIADLDAFLERMTYDPANPPGVKPMRNLKNTNNRKIEF